MKFLEALKCYFSIRGETKYQSRSSASDQFIAPSGILPRGKISRRHPYSSRVCKVKENKVLTVKVYSIYIRSSLDLLEQEQGGHGTSG